MDLIEFTAGYLETRGFQTSKRGRDLLVGNQISLGEERHTILVWVPSLVPGQSFSSQEEPYLSRFEGSLKEYPRAQKFMLVSTFEGLSAAFRSKAKREYDVNIRVPIQLFDTPYKWDEARESTSAARELSIRGEAREKTRVPQPYKLINSSDTRQSDDVLDTLLNKMTIPSSGGVHLIVGPAGIGKSVLFEVLFSRLYSIFVEHKNRLQIFPRPLPVLPEYMRVATASTLMSLVEGFLRTEFAAPITLETFEWMVTNGFGTWLLDGLDELVDIDPNFFNYLLELLTRPSSESATIVVCLRDSLLSTNEGLRDFCDEFGDSTNIYELSRWDTKSKRIFANIRLNNVLETNKFMTILQAHPEINSLSGIPYYCSLILDEYKAERLQDSYTETSLLHNAISRILLREYDEKGLLDRDLLPLPSLLDLLQDLAFENVTSDVQGIERDTIEEYTEILLPTELDRPTIKKLATDVVQLALFSQGAITGNVLFTSEIIEHYLLGERLNKSFRKNTDPFLRDLSSRFIPTEWVTLKTVAEQVRKEGNVPKLLGYLSKPNISEKAYRNILQICAYAIEDSTALKGVSIENRNISGVQFRRLDLSGVSFRSCNLTDTKYDKCVLRDTKFEGAIIQNTCFWMDEKDDLKGAQFGNTERLHSISMEPGKLDTDHKTIKKWLQEHTTISIEMVEPCSAAKQLRYMFGKFIHPNGVPKRVALAKHGILSGKKFYDAEATLEMAIKYGYFAEEQRYRNRVRRCEGDLYNEMLAYVTDLKPSPSLRELLNELCTVERCTHIPLI